TFQQGHALTPSTETPVRRTRPPPREALPGPTCGHRGRGGLVASPVPSSSQRRDGRKGSEEPTRRVAPWTYPVRALRLLHDAFLHEKAQPSLSLLRGREQTQEGCPRLPRREGGGG